MEDYSQTLPETQITTRRMPSLPQHWAFLKKPEILVFMHLPIYQGLATLSKDLQLWTGQYAGDQEKCIWGQSVSGLQPTRLCPPFNNHKIDFEKVLIKSLIYVQSYLGLVFRPFFPNELSDLKIALLSVPLR